MAYHGGMTGPSCALCHAPARPPFRAPAAELAPDLDMRPGEPARSTLRRWIATCRQCGASAPDLAAVAPGAAEVVTTGAYRALRTGAAEAPFLRWAMICEGLGQPADAAEAVLQAAWAADDAGRDASALRLRAASLWGGMDGLRLLDILRRAGAFAEAAAQADRLAAVAPDENSAAIIGFQRGRIAARDAGRHLISSALSPPARRPHVTHGQPRPQAARPGLWRRLFGG